MRLHLDSEVEAKLNKVRDLMRELNLCPRITVELGVIEQKEIGYGESFIVSAHIHIECVTDFGVK